MVVSVEVVVDVGSDSAGVAGTAGEGSATDGCDMVGALLRVNENKSWDKTQPERLKTR